MRIATISALLLTGCASANMSDPALNERVSPAPEVTASLPLFSRSGYLKPAEYPDLSPLVGVPPAEGPPGVDRDERLRDAAIALRGTLRYTQAQADADLRAPNPLDLYSCAANAVLSGDTAPLSTALLKRVAIDFGLSTRDVKARYERVRPFAQHGAASCTPAEEILRSNGSFPSGHSAIGWGWGLILSELFPERTDALLERGYEFGQSRVICDVHWQSDVDAGRIAASAIYARLHGVPGFREDMDAARLELANARPPAPPVDVCEAEEAMFNTGD